MHALDGEVQRGAPERGQMRACPGKAVPPWGRLAGKQLRIIIVSITLAM
jgi:hypothetical protein